MTNTYAINTTRKREFEVEQAMKDLGLRPWVPRRRDSRYIKEKRSAVGYDVAYVPKLIFSVIPAIYWPDVVKIKHVIGKPCPLSRLDIQGDASRNAPGLMQFRDAVEAEYADALRREANSLYQCQYEPGQALELLSGPFDGFRAQFQGVIKRAHNDYVRLRVALEVMGRETMIEVDPDKVRAG